MVDRERIEADFLSGDVKPLLWLDGERLLAQRVAADKACLEAHRENEKFPSLEGVVRLEILRRKRDRAAELFDRWLDSVISEWGVVRRHARAEAEAKEQADE